MATLETMPRDAAQHIFRLAFFRDYASLSVRQLKFLLKDRDVSIDGVVEKHELVELAHASDAASGTESDVNQRGVGRGNREYGPPSGADPKLPPSVEVPQLPRPEVYVHKRDAPQVPFDPVPVGVTLGLNAVKAAVHISMVSKELGDVVMDDTLWSAQLDALEEAFEDGVDPGTAKTRRTLRAPRFGQIQRPAAQGVVGHVVRLQPIPCAVQIRQGAVRGLFQSLPH